MPYPILKKANHLPEGEVPLKVMRFDDHGPSSDIHGHDFGELVIITRGRAVHLVEDRRYRISQGDVFVILPNTHHGYGDTVGFGLINLLFDWPTLHLPEGDLRTLPGYQALFEVEPRVRQRRLFRNQLRLGPKALGTLLDLVTALEQEIHLRTPGYRFGAVAQWMGIVLHLSRLYGQSPGVKTEREIPGLSRVLSHMESHLTETHSIESLATRAGMSPSTFFRTFAEVLGVPPIKHLTRLRIERAKHLLATPGIRVSEVSEAVGFEDSNYFARQFRQVTGMSPRQWQGRGRH